MEKTLDELREEADALGITYPKTIGAVKLQEKIDAFYDADSAANTAPVVVKKEVKKESDIRMKIKELEKANMETQIVKIACVDKREASYMTHAYFSTGDIGMNIPLDIWVEMPKILVALAEDSKALTHTERDGVTSSKLQKRYVVEYKNK